MEYYGQTSNDNATAWIQFDTGDASFNSIFGKVEVTNTAIPSTGTAYYFPYITGNTTNTYGLLTSNRIYLYDGTTTTYFCIGATDRTGGLTIRNANGNYADIVTSAFSANRTLTLPNEDGTFALMTNTDINALINLLGVGNSVLTGDDYIITQYVGGGTTTTTYHRRMAKNVRVGGLTTARSLWGNSFDGTADIGGSLIPDGNRTRDIGSDTAMWNNVHFRGIGTRHIDAATQSYITDGQLHIGYGSVAPTKAIYLYYSADTTSRTKFFEVNSSGAYALTRFGVNGQNTSYNFYTNGTSYFTDTLTIGARVATTAPSSLTGIDRIIITPYYHTGGPWKIASRDESSNAYLSLYYGSSELLRIRHDGTQILDFKGNATSATYLKDRTNSTASYLNYGASGLAASAITWLCCWNGYEVRAISKTEMANAVQSAASGSWGISVTGTAEKTTRLGKIADNTAGTDTNVVATDGLNVRWYTETGKISGQPSQWGFLFTVATGENSAETHQLWAEQSNGSLYHRGTNGSSHASPPAFKTILDSGNYTSYTVTKTGSGASGSWGISVTGSSASCTGNAATATNADKVDNYHASDLWRKDGGTWNGNANIACTPTANNQEYSFDLGNAHTGTYWHVWSGKNSKTILACYNDNMNVSVPNGTLTAKAFSGPLTGNVTGNCSGSSGSCTGNSNTANYQNCVATNEIRYARNGNMQSANDLWQGWAFAEGKVAVINGWRFGNGNGALAPIYGSKVYNAIWNDFAEYRESDVFEGGRVLVSDGHGKLVLATERLQPAARVISDTFGCSVGQSDKAKTPIGVAGRVLVYPYQDRNNYKVGDCLCAAPNGTADIMTREEIINYPDRIIGIVDEIPTYEVWQQSLTNYKKKDNGEIDEIGEKNTTDTKVNGRIWIYVR